MLDSFPPSRLPLADGSEVRVAVCLRAHHRTVCAPPVRCLEVVDCSVALDGSSPVYILADFFFVVAAGLYEADGSRLVGCVDGRTVLGK